MSKELKTLEDLNKIELDKSQLGLGKGHLVLIPENDLKQEATKHYKKFTMKTEEGIEMSNVASFIKHFFNITEEELK